MLISHAEFDVTVELTRIVISLKCDHGKDDRVQHKVEYSGEVIPPTNGRKFIIGSLSPGQEIEFKVDDETVTKTTKGMSQPDY